MLELGDIPETSKLGPTPAQKDLQSILETLAPEEAKEIKIIKDPWPLEGFAFESPKGSIYLIKRDDSNYIHDSSVAGKYGTEIFQAMYAWAHNNGKVIHEDTRMTDEGIYRRTSHMLSSAIRHKTTKHFSLGKLSGIDNWASDDSLAATEHNIGLLALRERDLVMNRLPELKSLRYDIPTRSYYDGEFRIPDAEVKTYIERRIEGMGSPVSSRVGHATARRVLFIDALERSWTGTPKSTVVGYQSGPSQSLAGMRYSKDSRGSATLEAKDPRKGERNQTSGPSLWRTSDSGGEAEIREGASRVPGGRPLATGGEPASVSGRVGPERSRRTLVSNPPTVSHVEQILDGIQSRWGSQLKTKVHESVDTISDQRLREGAQREGNVEAFFDPTDGTIHIIADRVNGEADVERLLRHEGIHWALNGPLRREYLGLLNDIRELIPAERWQELSQRYEGHSDAAIVEEYLAYEGQNNPRSSAWQSFAYEVKRLLRQIFGDKIRFTDSDVLALLSKANRDLERNSSPGVTQTSSDQGVSYSKKGQGRENWDDVQSGDDFNAVKKLLPRSADAPVILDARGEPDQVYQKVAQSLRSHPTVTDPDGLTVLIANPEGHADINLQIRAKHLSASKEDRYKKGERIFDPEKAKWTPNIWKTISDYGAKVEHYSDTAYVRKYKNGAIHIVFVEQGRMVEQLYYDAAIVSQRSLDSTKGLTGATILKKRKHPLPAGESK